MRDVLGLKKVQIPIKNIKIFQLERRNHSKQKKEMIIPNIEWKLRTEQMTVKKANNGKNKIVGTRSGQKI